MLLWLAGINCGNPLQGLTFDGTTWCNKDLYTRSKTENACLPDCKKLKMLYPNLAMCQLATWAEHAVKFKLKLSKKWKRKPNKNRMEWSERQNENNHECGKCK